MKKSILIISLLFLLITPVYAKDNRLYFTESGDRLYYESKLLDENVFMKHEDLIPGASYQDTLIIENGTNTKYTLYFKVTPQDLSSEAQELLESISMTIKIDGTKIYEGKATGLDYTAEGVDLQQAILLGDFTPHRSSTMVVDTKLLESYSNTHNLDASYIDWAFYASYEDKKPDIINPDTYAQKEKKYTQYIFFGILLLLVFLIGYMKRKETKKAK